MSLADSVFLALAVGFFVVAAVYALGLQRL